MSDGRPVTKIRGGSPEARNPIAPASPRRCSARVVSDRIEYLSIDSDLLDVLLTWDQTGTYEVSELQERRRQRASDDWMTILLQTKAFHIPPANIQAIFMRMQRVRLSRPARPSFIKAMKATISTRSSKANAS